jgi:hypothetical protein
VRAGYARKERSAIADAPVVWCATLPWVVTRFVAFPPPHLSKDLSGRPSATSGSSHGELSVFGSTRFAFRQAQIEGELATGLTMLWKKQWKSL